MANNELRWTNDELQRTNTTLKRQSLNLKEALEQNTEILGIASHDLKNPLGGILSIAELTLEDLQHLPAFLGKGDLQENLDLIQASASQMHQIVVQLLDSHRVGHQHLHLESVNLNECAAMVLGWNQLKAEGKGITLEYTSRRLPTVTADASALQRVMDNLISNAIKYSPPDTSVAIWWDVFDSAVVFNVKDNGPGLTPDDHAKVFGKLQRLSATPTGGEHSAGLGLYIVRQLVEQHGGEVGVESTHGAGARFYFSLPLPLGDGATSTTESALSKAL